MADKKTLSIIVPDTSPRDSLNRTVTSVLGQQVDGLECLVASSRSDELRSVLPVQDERLRFLDVPQDANMAQAINLSLPHISGQLVGILASEDMVWAEGLSEIQRLFVTHPKLQVAYGQAVYVDERGQRIRNLRIRKPTRIALSKRPCLCSSAVFYSREVLKDAGNFDASLQFWSQYEMWFRLITAGVHFRRLPKEIAGVRLRQMDATSSKLDFEAELRSCDEAMQLVRKYTGNAGAHWPLRSGFAAAAAADVHRQSKDFDMHVLAVAMQHADTLKGSRLPVNLQKSAILATHVKTECGVALRHPRVALRVLPDRYFKYVKRSLPLRIFRLRVDEPHLCKLPESYLSVTQLSNPPCISIVTPNLNQGPFIERTIRSVIDQDYPNLQYVVQDGLSNDESLAVIRRYEDRISRWESVKDSGQSNAINMGLQHTTGEIMAYLNSDDTLVPGSLHFVADYFSRHPEIDVVYGYRLLIDEQDKLINRWILPEHDSDLLPWADFIPQETMFWRRRAWDAVGSQIDESFHFAMDWDLILRFRAAGLQFARLPRFLGAFRITDSQKTNQLAATTGASDIARLRKRELGFVPSETEIGRKVRPYIRKQRRADRNHVLYETVCNSLKPPFVWDYTQILAPESTANYLQRAA
jgi:glycosyltransferase involved in cell wall biosynthesis